MDGGSSFDPHDEVSMASKLSILPQGFKGRSNRHAPFPLLLTVN
jgi:hypothetical protein